MKPAPAEVLVLAEAWYRQQMTKLEAKHGTAWRDHQAWVGDQLRELLRQRLVERGWRRK